MRKGRVLAAIMAAIMLISTFGSSSVYEAAPSDTVSTEKVSIEKTSTDDGKISDYRENLNYRDNSNMNFDFSFEDEEELGLSRNWGVLPKSYSSSAFIEWDFEKVNDYVTPVKDQNPYGTCWAHSTIAAAETTYIINERIKDVESIDFNEYHLVHYTYDTPADLLRLFGGDTNVLLADDSFLDAGGNNSITAGVLANWIGVSDSTEFAVDDVEVNNSDALGFEDVAHLENAYYIGMPDMTSDSYWTDMNIVKSMLMEYGAMAVSYYSCSSGGNEFDGYYYCPNEYGTNHAVTLVGWDDSIPAEAFETTAPGDGAWLIKNSWGEYGDFGGYFWLSYYDNTLADTAYVYDMVPADNYDNNYQYDGANGDYYAGYQDAVVFANAFVADSVESLEAVGFYTYNTNVDYEIRVYKNLEANEAPQYGDLVLTQTGTETFAGFHTVELNSLIDLAMGERYAVVVTLSKEGEDIYASLDATYAYNWIGFQSYARDGESYLGYSIATLNDLNADNTEYAEGYNVRLKAYTNEGATLAVASGKCGNNLTWTLGDDDTLTISGTGAMWNFWREDSDYKTLPWKEYLQQIKKVVFCEGVTTVGNAAFIDSASLEKVVFTDSITSIGNFAFKYCLNVENVNLPENLKILGQECFAECDALRELVIPDSVTYFGGGIAEWCDSLEYIYIGGVAEAFVTWGDTLFRACPSLEAIDVSADNVAFQSVDGVLYSKDGKTLIQYPGGKQVGTYEVLSTTEQINNYAFQRAIYLENVVIPEGVLTIGRQAFSYCSALKSFTIPSTVTTFGGDILNQTFNVQIINNKSSVEFELPPLESGVWKDAEGNVVTSITNGVVFRGEEKTEEETDDIGQCGENVYWSLDENMVLTIYGSGPMWSFYSGDAYYHVCPWADYRTQIKKVVFSEGVTTVGCAAFDSHYAIESVEFADTITKIDSFAFRYCENLSNFELPEGLKSLGQECFANCDTITQLIIPDDITFYGGNIARSCESLEYVYIGGHNKAATIIHASSLCGNCPSLEVIEVSEKNSVFQSVDGVLYSKDGEALIQYPAGKKDPVCEILSTTKQINQLSFEGAVYLENVIIPEGVTNIGTMAFGRCAVLESLIIPSTVTSLGSSILNGSNNVTIVNNKSNVEFKLPVIIGITWTDLDGNVITSITNGVALSDIENFVVETGIALNQTSATLGCGELLQLYATVTPTDATIKDVTYSSSDIELATVSPSGLVTVNTNGKAGTVVITATTAYAEKTATCTIVVEPVKVSSISFAYNPNTTTLRVGSTLQITATVNPSNATNKALNWATSNANVATVDVNGKVTAVGVGTATITATAADGSGVSKSCTITVKAPLVDDVTLNVPTYRPTVGEQIQFSVAIEPENAEYELTWISSDKSVATIDEDGVLTAVAVGTTEVSAIVKSGYTTYTRTVTITVVPVKVTGITLSKTTLELINGNSETLIATVTPANAGNKVVTWSSSNTKVATVDANGKVTAVGVGTAIITVTATDGSDVKASCTVTVKPILVSAITLNKTTLELINGNSTTLTAVVSPTDADNKAVTWSSSNTKVAIVDANGKVTAVGVGTATITATAKDGSGVKASCTVTVKPILVSAITLNKASVSLFEKDTVTLTATVTPANAANKAVTWSSSNTKVAAVDANGKVTAVGVGTATITATAKDGSGVKASCTVTVKPILVSTITLNKTSVSLFEKDTVTLIATVTPANAANKAVTWSSSNTKVATVDANGKVTAVGVGTATITATAKDGSGVKVSCTLTVKQKYVNGLNEYTDGKLYYFKDNKIDTTYNGVADYKGDTWYVKNGKVDTSVNGLQNWGGKWYLFANGKVSRTNTVAKNSVGWWYVSNGEVAFNYDGVGTNSSGTWYIENGQVDFSKNGLYQRGGTWYYFKGGAVDYTYTGLTNSSVGWWYIENGIITYQYTDLTKYAGSWWYVQNSKLNFKYDGVAKNSSGTWYIEDSKVDFGKNGLYQRGSTWYYFKGGAVDYKYTGLTNSSVGWWYIENGLITYKYTGLAKYAGSWWYVQNSKLNFKYDGVAKNSSGTWYIEDSKVDFKKNGLYQRGGTWYLFKGGAVNKIDSVEKYGGSWWYVDDGVIDFDYNGLGSNASGTWYIKNGKVDFSYNGTYKFKGKTYKVVNGKATAIK